MNTPTNSVLEVLPSNERIATPEKDRYQLNIALVYENALSCSWGSQYCNQAAQSVGRECVKVKYWEIAHLAYPVILPDAVRSAVEADLIIISMCNGDHLPPDLCAWISIWLPRRGQREGAVVALIGRPGHACASASPVRAYLEVVARRARLDFMVQERKLVAGAQLGS